MIRRTWSRLFLVIGMSVAFPLSSPPVSTRPLVIGSAQAEGTGSALATSAATIIVASPSVTTGQPGLSFRYVQTFGQTDEAYIDDHSHLNYPYGVTTDGANVWVADRSGLRAVKYQSDGTFLTQIGKTGFRYGTGDSLEQVADVAVDTSGNVWLVDNDAHHVLKFNAGGNLVAKLGRSYNSGPGNDQFNQPNGIAFDGAGNIYISDSGNDRIQVFSPSGAYSATIGITGIQGSDTTHFCYPQHITVYAPSQLYVADSCNHRVQVFNVTDPVHASYVATIGVTGVSGYDSIHFDHPLGVAVDNNRIYVADENNHRVQVFNRTNRAYLATIGDGWGSDNAHLRDPSDVAVDTAGNIYVADWFNARVQQFNSSLAYVRTFGTTAVPYLTDNLHYNKPAGLAVAPDGSLYLTEVRGHRLIKLNAQGTPLWMVGVAGVSVDSTDNAHLNYPSDVALAPTGLVYVADSGNNRVQIFNPSGLYYGTLGVGNGTGDYQFSYPRGVFVASDGSIYVADSNNHRVQIYNSSRVYVATIGVTGVSGSDNTHLNSPSDVAVDGRGMIYVSESGNYRVQVFNAARQYVRTIGVTGAGGNDFGRLNGPGNLAVDVSNNVYISSPWSHWVDVYDLNGGFLTRWGSFGSGTGNLDDPLGVAVDSAGTLYIADQNNQRIQKLARGVPGWQQVNVNGFGVQGTCMNPLGVYQNQFYMNYGGNQLWRSADAVNWTSVVTNTFGQFNGSPQVIGVLSNTLYAASNNFGQGATIYSSTNGTVWTNVVTAGFGITTNYEIINMTVYSGSLYAATLNSDNYNSYGGQVWRSSDGAHWTNVVTAGFGLGLGQGWWAFEVFDNLLYAATNVDSGGLIYRTDGASWTPVTTDGFGNPGNGAVTGLAGFNGYLYAATRNTNTGTEVWRSSSGDPGSWTKVQGSGLGNSTNFRGYILYVFNNHLYLGIINEITGDQLWRTADGLHWEKAVVDGWGSSLNTYTVYSNRGLVTFNQHMFAAPCPNGGNGGQLWRTTVTADFLADRTIVRPSMAMSFTNFSAGDYITSTWNFGDGGTLAGQLPQVVTHTYASRGVYTVTLTVTDSVDTNTISHTNYILVGNRIYLPIVRDGSVAQDVSSISAAGGHTCALTSRGGVKCWGGNWFGELGDGTNTNSNTPVDVFGLTSGVSVISAGLNHICALTTSGGVKCWGDNGSGELGDGTNTDRNMPADVSGLTRGVSAIDAGYDQTCALTTSGGVKCWGDNEYGQLGDGTNTDRNTPVDVSNLTSGVSAIDVGGYHTCALTPSGGVKCWGSNWWGQLGDGTNTDRNTPVDVNGLTSGVSFVSVGDGHTCAMITNGGAKCWGANYNGALGDGTNTDRYTPVDILGLTSGVSALSTGGSHTCALTSSGGAKCWGGNGWGELGDGTNTSRNRPAAVNGLTSGVSAISAGNSHTCALTTSGGAKCWGYNHDGQVGDGTNTDKNMPVDVFGLLAVPVIKNSQLFSPGRRAGASDPKVFSSKPSVDSYGAAKDLHK